MSLIPAWITDGINLSIPHRHEVYSLYLCKYCIVLIMLMFCKSYKCCKLILQHFRPITVLANWLADRLTGFLGYSPGSVRHRSLWDCIDRWCQGLGKLCELLGCKTGIGKPYMKALMLWESLWANQKVTWYWLFVWATEPTFSQYPKDWSTRTIE